MFDLYPNILKVILADRRPADASGDYPVSELRQSEYALCRAVRNASAQSVRLSAGMEYRFSYVVYMPAGTAPLKLGTPVRIYAGDDGELIAQGRVADFVSGPLGCKLWL